MNAARSKSSTAKIRTNLARVVRIIVEQYDGDVKAFVDSIRYRAEVNFNKPGTVIENVVDMLAVR